MGLYLKQFFRSPIKAAAFLLLLIIAASALNIGLNAYVTVSAMTDEVESLYTTIATPNYHRQGFQPLNRDTNGKSERQISEEFERYNKAVKELIERAEYVDAALEAARDCELVDALEIRSTIGCYSPTIEPVINRDGMYGTGTYPSSVSMFDVTCTAVYKNSFRVTAVCEPNEILYENAEIKLHWANAHKKLIIAYDGENVCPFEAGKRYIVVGSFLNEEGSLSTINAGSSYGMPGSGQSINYIDEKGNDSSVVVAGNSFYPGGPLLTYWSKLRPYYPDYQYIIEIPDGKTGREMIADSTDANLMALVTMCEYNLHSLQAVTTNNLDAILWLLSGTASISQGRKFTEDEYASGAKVCLISAGLAEANGLSVGDRLSLTLYARGDSPRQFNEVVMNSRDAIDPYLDGVTPCCEPDEYEIVGIYTDEGFTNDVTAFWPNTVIIPQNCVADPDVLDCSDYYRRTFDEYDTTRSSVRPDKMITLVLKNGTIDEFEQYMTDRGYPDCFVYEDVGYEEAKISISTMQANVRKLTLVTLALFAVVGVLYAFLYSLTMRKISYTSRLLGKRRTSVYLGTVLSCIVIAAAAFAASAFISALAYGSVCRALISDEIAYVFSPKLTALAFSAETAYVALFAVLFRLELLKRNAMKMMKR